MTVIKAHTTDCICVCGHRAWEHRYYGSFIKGYRPNACFAGEGCTCDGMECDERMIVR